MIFLIANMSEWIFANRLKIRSKRISNRQNRGIFENQPIFPMARGTLRTHRLESNRGLGLPNHQILIEGFV